MTTLARTTVLGFAALLLGACSMVMVEDRVGPGWAYYDGDFAYATNKGAIVTRIAGNPFDGNPNVFADTVRSMMYGQTEGEAVYFVPEESERTLPPFKVVIAFNTPGAVDGFDLCEKGASTPTLPTGDVLRMAAAFCEGDRMKSDAYGRVGNVRDIADPRFRELVQRVTRAMIPPDGADDSGSDNNVP